MSRARTVSVALKGAISPFAMCSIILVWDLACTGGGRVPCATLESRVSDLERFRGEMEVDLRRLQASHAELEAANSHMKGELGQFGRAFQDTLNVERWSALEDELTYKLDLLDREFPVMWKETEAEPLGRVTARDFLLRDVDEAEGYGLYSYILFAAPVTDSTGPRYLRTLEAWVSLILPVDEVERYVPPKEVNLTYVPITADPDTDSKSAGWILDHYDYARAVHLLAKIPGNQRDGPYIVSTLKPLGQTDNVSGKYLLQDLSRVPPDLVELWVREFMREAGEPEFWEPSRVRRVALNLRTVIGVAGEGYPSVRGAVADWISWFD